GDELVITTTSLPNAEDGFDYTASVEAAGGTPPYAWLITDGVLPAGISLLADGTLTGAPSEVGEFPLTFRALDSALPPQHDERDLTLTVSLAPLEIIGDQQFDLLLLKVIVLPLMTPIEGIPVPYDTQLGARGGLRPYHWVEGDIPAGVDFLLPMAGIPDGLTLEEDGRLHGSVTDTSLVTTITIPLTGIDLSGFFFFAEVSDSQDPAETKSAIFLIPTVPIGGP
ncbi:MAG: hypothetical protein KDA28_04430, partial [Phycisphaerales bacterium]|nr:hypothetical protein [Phycisphaerales bacterium]